MATRLHLKCDGCDAETHSEAIRKRFETISGQSYGFGTFVVPDLDTVVPDGWIWSDPYTSCTYCPKCWQQITRLQR